MKYEIIPQPAPRPEERVPTSPERSEKQHQDIADASSLIISFLKDRQESIPAEIHGRVNEILREMPNVLNALPQAADDKKAEELLSLASLSAGIDQIIEELEKDSANKEARADREALVALLEHYQFSIDALPRGAVIFDDPKKRLAEFKERVAEGARYPYAKLLKISREVVERKVADATQSWLEAAARLMPSVESRRIIAGASKLSGKIAAGATALGLSLLALHVGDAFANVNVSQDESGRDISIEKDTGEKIEIIALDQMQRYTEAQQPCDLQRQLTFYDTTAEGGVNYTVSRPDLFERAITEDAARMSAELCNKDVRELGPAEFIKVVSAMVQERGTYDHLATKETAKGQTENELISNMPLDELYLEHGAWVCRHYAALVEKIGETLITAGQVPKCAGLSIDEVLSTELSHAWNIFYLTPRAGENKVVVGFTDATQDDKTGAFFDALEARDANHPSVAAAAANSQRLFTPAEMRTIYESLIKMKLGGLDEEIIRRELAAMLFEDGMRTKDPALKERAVQLLQPIDLKAAQAEYPYQQYVNNLALHYREAGQLDKAAEVLQQAVQAVSGYASFKLAAELADVRAEAGRAAEAGAVMRNAIATLAFVERGDFVHSALAVYIKHNLGDVNYENFIAWLNPPKGAEYPASRFARDASSVYNENDNVDAARAILLKYADEIKNHPESYDAQWTPMLWQTLAALERGQGSPQDVRDVFDAWRQTAPNEIALLHPYQDELHYQLSDGHDKARAMELLASIKEILGHWNNLTNADKTLSYPKESKFVEMLARYIKGLEEQVAKMK